MPGERQINQTVRQAVTAALGSNAVRVDTSPTTDSEGNDALRVRITLTPGSTEAVRGAALKTLVKIHDRLQEIGEERFPIIEYVE
jgi:hypothetical protein